MTLSLNPGLHDMPTLTHNTNKVAVIINITTSFINAAVIINTTTSIINADAQDVLRMTLFLNVLKVTVVIMMIMLLMMIRMNMIMAAGLTTRVRTLPCIATCFFRVA